MSLYEVILIAVGLAMDAFAVAICKGLAMKKTTFSKMLTVGLWFGIFQGGMPLIGYFIGSTFSAYITAYDHWVAFVLLLLIGGNMIREACSKKDEPADCSLSFRTMLLLAVATSIDALAIGVTFAINRPAVGGIWLSVFIIGIITFAISFAGVKIGNLFGSKFEKKAELAGGIILIIIGLKILIEGIIETAAL